MEGLSTCEEMVRAMAGPESIKVNPSEGVVRYKTEPRFKGKSRFVSPKRGLVKKTVFREIIQFIDSCLRRALGSFFSPEPQVTIMSNKSDFKNKNNKKKIYVDKKMGLINPIS